MSDPFPGKLREYCLRNKAGSIVGEVRVWARTIDHATYNFQLIMPVGTPLHVSSVRTMAEETEETLRDA